MRVTHIITRLVVGGAQENTIATVLGLRGKPDVTVQLISGPTTGPEGSLEHRLTERDQTLNVQRSTQDTQANASSNNPSMLNAECSTLNAPHNSLLTIVPTLVRPVHPLKDFLALQHLTRLLKDQKPDIVHTHSGKAGILGRIAAARAKVPVIIHHIHGPSFGPFQGNMANTVFTAAERYAGKFTTHFLCSANAMTRLYLASGIGEPENYTRVFSGFQVEPFAAATNDPLLRDNLSIPRDAFVIGKIARLFPLKGHSDLLSVLKRILPECPQAHVLCVGDGSLRPHLEARVRELDLTNKVTFTGLVPPAEVPRYVGVMDCLAHLSEREGLARALPQALAAGKPVVTYDCDGAREVCLDSKTGFLARPGHESLVAERLLLLAHDPKLRTEFGQRGQSFVRANFDVEQMVDTIYRLYEALTARHTSQRL